MTGDWRGREPVREESGVTVKSGPLGALLRHWQYRQLYYRDCLIARNVMTSHITMNLGTLLIFDEHAQEDEDHVHVDNQRSSDVILWRQFFMSVKHAVHVSHQDLQTHR